MPVNCELCNKEFKYICFLKKHLERKIPCVKKEFVCKKCKKVFKRSNNYKRHINMKYDCLNKVIVYKKNDETSDHYGVDITKHIGSNKVIPFELINYEYMIENLINVNKMFDTLKYAALPSICFRLMYISPKHPECHCIMMKHIKNETIYVKSKNGWTVRDFNDFIRDFFSNLQYFLMVFKNENEDDERFTDKLKENLKNIDEIFDLYFDEETSQDINEWIKTIKINLMDANEMLKYSKKKDIRK